MSAEKIGNEQGSERLRAHRNWIGKFQNSVSDKLTQDLSEFILEGNPTNNDNEEKFIAYENEAIVKLEMLASQDKYKEIFSQCSCVYPINRLEDIKIAYSKTKDIKIVHQMLQKQFEEDIAENPYRDKIISNNMGMAGTLENGNKIIITMTPNEPEIYFETNDLQTKMVSYCHCARVKKQMKENKQAFSMEYCYCGANYYKNIWQEILGKELSVNIIETALKGSSICKFVIEL